MEGRNRWVVELHDGGSEALGHSAIAVLDAKRKCVCRSLEIALNVHVEDTIRYARSRCIHRIPFQPTKPDR